MTDYNELPQQGRRFGAPLDGPGDGPGDEQADEVLTVSEFVTLFATEPADFEGGDEAYRYCDNPFCGCTYDKTRFLQLVGVVDDWGDLTRYGERVRYLWSTDPAADTATPLASPGASIGG